jgi:hypothetical protein
MAPAFLLFLAQLIFSTLKMEAIYSPETSVETQRTTRRYIPEDSTPYIYDIILLAMKIEKVRKVIDKIINFSCKAVIVNINERLLTHKCLIRWDTDKCKASWR